MSYSSEQLSTLQHIKTLLDKAGLEADDLGNLSTPSSSCSSDSDNNITPFKYSPSPAIILSSDETAQGKGRVTRKSCMQSIVEHPASAVVEFPETGASMNIAVGHRFPIIIKSFTNPKNNIQYSLGGVHAIRDDVTCHLLRDRTTGQPVKCKQTKVSCCSIKHCNFTQDILPVSSPSAMTHTDAEQEVFMKTLGFYCALGERGCSIGLACEDINDDTGDSSRIYAQSPEESGAVLHCTRSSKAESRQNCKGKLILDNDKYNKLFIRCEHYGHSSHGHLILRNISDYNSEYLQALFRKDKSKINAFEESARNAGYGPLVPCTVTTACREQKDLCPFWHRDSRGILQRGQLINAKNCPSRFEIYQPYNLQKCPFILLVCRHPHTHPPPTRTKTPESILKIFTKLLDHLEWRLADATPRRILLDTAFMSGLRQTLNWDGISDPTLNDLHPSLGNFDHVARIINKLRFKRYPHGTGLEGANLLYTQNLDLEKDNRYIRSVESYQTAGNDAAYHIIICMFPAMSHLLLKTKRPSIDTSFKRLHGWQEFEMEAYFPDIERSLVVARAFTTSQSAEAHLNLFRRIFQIVEEDTGESVKFRHIHNCGIDTITADGHRGQALGLGLYCQEICQGKTEYCSVERFKLLSSLTPTDHLSRFYRYCFAHFSRNISNLRGHVSEKVLDAMRSLATADPLPDLEAVFQTIHNGGKKAVGVKM